MKILLFILFLFACTPVEIDPDISGTYTVTHQDDTWQWTFTKDGKLYEPSNCGEWYFQHEDLYVSSGMLVKTLRGRIVKAEGGWDYLVWGEVYQLRN